MNYFLITIEFSEYDNKLINLTMSIETDKAFFTNDDIIKFGKNFGYEIDPKLYSIRFIYKLSKREYQVWMNMK